MTPSELSAALELAARESRPARWEDPWEALEETMCRADELADLVEKLVARVRELDAAIASITKDTGY